MNKWNCKKQLNYLRYKICSKIEIQLLIYESDMRHIILNHKELLK